MVILVNIGALGIAVMASVIPAVSGGVPASGAGAAVRVKVCGVGRAGA